MLEIKLADRFFPNENQNLSRFEQFKQGKVVRGESAIFDDAGQLAAWYERNTPKERVKQEHKLLDKINEKK